MTPIQRDYYISTGELMQEIAEAVSSKKLRLTGCQFETSDFERLLHYVTQINKLTHLQFTKRCLTREQVTKLLIKVNGNRMKGVKLHDEYGRAFGNIYTDWHRYNEEKKDVSDLRETTKKALTYFKTLPEHIIEFGASTGQETVLLVKKCRVLTAIDGDKEAISILRSRISKMDKTNLAKLIIYEGQFTLFRPNSLADIFISNLTWPYRPKADFPECWKASVRCVKKNGLLAGTLFGPPAEIDPG